MVQNIIKLVLTSSSARVPVTGNHIKQKTHQLVTNQENYIAETAVGSLFYNKGGRKTCKYAPFNNLTIFLMDALP